MSNTKRYLEYVNGDGIFHEEIQKIWENSKHPSLRIVLKCLIKDLPHLRQRFEKPYYNIRYHVSTNRSKFKKYQKMLDTNINFAKPQTTIQYIMDKYPEVYKGLKL